MSDVRITRTAASRYNALFITAGFICALISLIWQPLLFGAAGVVLGILATRNRSRVGIAVIISSMALMAIGLFKGAVILNYLRLWLRI